MSKPREYTEDEVRDRFIKQVRAIVHNWSTTPTRELSPNQTEAEWRVSGAAFSILAMLDGSGMGLPGFIIAPYPHEKDRESFVGEGQNWFPENHQSVVNCDIGGGLHEYFHKK